MRFLKALAVFFAVTGAGLYVLSFGFHPVASTVKPLSP